MYYKNWKAKQVSFTVQKKKLEWCIKKKNDIKKHKPVFLWQSKTKLGTLDNTKMLKNDYFEKWVPKEISRWEIKIRPTGNDKISVICSFFKIRTHEEYF